MDTQGLLSKIENQSEPNKAYVIQKRPAVKKYQKPKTIMQKSSKVHLLQRLQDQHQRIRLIYKFYEAATFWLLTSV